MSAKIKTTNSPGHCSDLSSLLLGQPQKLYPLAEIGMPEYQIKSKSFFFIRNKQFVKS